MASRKELPDDLSEPVRAPGADEKPQRRASALASLAAAAVTAPIPGQPVPPQPSPGQYPYPGFPPGQHPGVAHPIGYGYPVPHTGGRRKMWSLAVVLLGIVLVAGSIGVWSLASALRAIPTEASQFGNGGSTDVTFRAGETKFVYAQTDAKLHRMECADVTAGDRGGLSSETAADITINNWQALLEVTAEKAGTYTIACKGVDGDRFGIGKPVSSTPFWALGVGGLAALGSLVFFVVGAVRK